ncbi:MAG TPA: stage V sporulation protein AC [Candidatus Blautia avistercoris]|uniref:stage V sporulation protein AC n=1 Tax=Blautia sp. An249 TaxID=1965603 RepID=UPI000B39FF66|nr:stage V sporulation protein AC [Blautia sp. An249]OUO78814.1 stage V sporulation protein AC [Blautia sp. An249]HIY19656.1 stage V sporulation protein AC [Candidatus Blautia avistercoris]
MVEQFQDIAKKKKEKEYQKYVKKMTPTHNLALNMLKAFLVGGLICTLGQVILHTAEVMGADEKTAGSWCSLILIFISVVLTGLNIYPRIGKFAGAGALVPITGFANSVAASAIEFKKEGQVFGIGCKIFTIAGPVILYGILSSWALGVIYYILLQLGVTG